MKNRNAAAQTTMVRCVYVSKYLSWQWNLHTYSWVEEVQED